MQRKIDFHFLQMNCNWLFSIRIDTYYVSMVLNFSLQISLARFLHLMPQQCSPLKNIILKTAGKFKQSLFDNVV